jgi:hypothetical protein
MSTSISAAGSHAATIAGASFGTELNALSPEEKVLALMVFSQCSQMAEAKTSIDLSSEQMEKLREQVKKSLEEAMAAEKKSGFWGSLSKLFGSDLASIATAVAAVAATIASGGAAAAILAVVAAAAAFAADHAKELGIPVEVAMCIAVAAGVAAMCCGDAGALFKVGKTLKDTADTVKLAATGAEFALKGTGAACQYQAADYEHDAGLLHADARGFEGRRDLASTDIDDAIQRFSAALDKRDGVVRATSQMQEQHAASQFAILNNFGGAA